MSKSSDEMMCVCVDDGYDVGSDVPTTTITSERRKEGITEHLRLEEWSWIVKGRSLRSELERIGSLRSIVRLKGSQTAGMPTRRLNRSDG